MATKIVRKIQIFLILNAFFWFVLAITWLFRLSKYQGEEYIVYSNSIAMFLNAILFIVFSKLLEKRNVLIFYMGIFYLIILIILTIADEFGVFDFFVLILEFIPLYLLFKYQKYLV